MALFVACATGAQALAQTPPARTPSIPLASPTQLPQMPADQAEAFAAYQRCVAGNRQAVDLHNASSQIVNFRDNRAQFERMLQADPGARQRLPGGVDQALAQLFTHYRAFGGTAASVAEVRETPNPCPSPKMEFARPPPASAPPSISQQRQMAVPPGYVPPKPPNAAPPPPFTPAASPPLRRALEQAWLAHLAAVRLGSESELAATTSPYYFGTKRNGLAHAGRSLTRENVVALGLYYPDLNTTRYVTVIEKGPTAALVHAKDSAQSQPDGKPRVDYYVLRFADEGRGWKLDGLGTVNAPKYGADGSPAPFSLPANAHPDFRIDGQIRPAPAPVALPK